MAFDAVESVFDLGRAAIERIWPDPIRRAEEMRKLEQLRQDGSLREMEAHVQLMLAQIKVNEESAKHPSMFVSGARPMAIWAGVAALTWSGLFHPMLMWVWAVFTATGVIPAGMAPPPLIDAPILGTITASLLGVAGMRTFDKTKGTAKDSL